LAVASFHNSSTQLLRLRSVLILASFNFSKLSDSRVKIQNHCSLFETVATVSNFHGFSPLMLIWSLIVLKLWFVCSKCSQKWILGSLWKETAVLIGEV